MLIILVLLLMVYLVASPMWSEDAADETSAEPTYTVAVIDHSSLVGLDLTVDGETLNFALNDTATEWDWSEDSEVPLDNVVFATVVTELNEAGSKYKLENVTDEELADYGLSDPRITLKFVFSDGTVQEYKIGNLNSFNGLYYLSESGAPNTVYMIDSSVVYSLELDIYDFVLEDTPPAITEAKILGVNCTKALAYRNFAYYPSGNSNDYTDRYEWYFNSGATNVSVSSPIIPPLTPLRTDLADSLTALITGLAFDECVALDYTTGEFGFSEGQKLVISYNVDENDTGVLTKKEYVIYIGSQREDGSIYVHTDDSKLVYTLSSSDEWLDIINVSDLKLSPDEIWLPNYELIDSLTFTAGESTLTVNVKNTDGVISYSSDATDDADALTALIEALDGLTATSNTVYLEEDAAAQKTEVFAVKIAFNSGADSELEIKVTRYSESYCLVSFDGREDQLITLEDAQELAGMISAIFAVETKAA